MANTIDELREMMFATMRGLMNKETPMDIERAKAVSQAAAVLVDTARVECKFMDLTGSKGSGFIPTNKQPQLSKVS